jgi:hypothetical protein
MNVARAFFDGKREDVIGKPDDWGIFRSCRQFNRIGRLVLLLGLDFKSLENLIL